jgi:16S rRNA (cytosine967-C5)-methyltransferase
MNEREISVLSDLMRVIDKKPAVAPEIINDYLAKHKFIKGPEKAEFLQSVWSMIRAKARLIWAYPDDDWQVRVQKFMEKGIPDVSQAPDWVQWETPEWFLSHIPEAKNELPALLENPPIILRAIGHRDEILENLKNEGLDVAPCDKSPFGIVLKTYTNIKNTNAWKKGLLEIQDEGAQLLSLEIGIKPKQSVFDFCAGAGGKSLIFAQMMQNQGQIQAYDITPKKLFELVKRATRAQIKIIKIITKLERPDKKFDHVVVDAPCSGCGTWRRTPNMRWHLTEKQLKHITKTQAEILNRAEQYLKTGGYLSYITCSLTFDENEQQVEKFLSEHPNYKVIKQKRYSPYLTKTDGFFLCVMQKTS